MNSTDLPDGPFKFLVVLGESTVEGGGWLSDPKERWADILCNLLEHAQEAPLSCHNAGIGASVISPNSPGYEASAKPSAAERLEDEILSRNPDLVVIAYGLNDMRAGMSLSAFRSEMEQITERIQESCKAMIVIVNVYYQSAYHYYPPFDKGSVSRTKEYNQMLVELAASRGLVHADVYSAEGEKDFLIHQDCVHENKLGNMLIAHKVCEAIVLSSPGIARNMQERNSSTSWTKQSEQLKVGGATAA